MNMYPGEESHANKGLCDLGPMKGRACVRLGNSATLGNSDIVGARHGW